MILLFTSMFLSPRFEPIFSLSTTTVPMDSFCSMAIEFVTSTLHMSPLFDHGFISVVGSTLMSSLVSSTHEILSLHCIFIAVVSWLHWSFAAAIVLRIASLKAATPRLADRNECERICSTSGVDIDDRLATIVLCIVATRARD